MYLLQKNNIFYRNVINCSFFRLVIFEIDNNITMGRNVKIFLRVILQCEMID